MWVNEVSEDYYNLLPELQKTYFTNCGVCQKKAERNDDPRYEEIQQENERLRVFPEGKSKREGEADKETWFEVRLHGLQKNSH